VRRFTPSHRGGPGPPLVLLHGFLDSWRTWELVVPQLEGVGHCPQLDVPLEAAQLILGVTAR
jgi:hypothetical protein